MDWVFMQSPEGEVKEVEATAEALTPLMVAGWHQVPAPAASGPRSRQLRLRRKSSMANINELMEGWGFGKQTAIGTANCVDRHLASHQPQYQAVGEGPGERGRPG